MVRSSLKSLQQREAEYAEARQRILGKEAAPLPDTKQGHKQKKFENGGGGSGGGRKPLNVDRAPKGPDGTAGFPARR